MGYLANKKHLAFVTASLRTFLFLSAIITLFAFGKNNYGQFMNEYRWQLYLLLTIAFLYTLVKKMPILCLSFFILGSINFFCITSSINLFNFQPRQNTINILFENRGHNPLKVIDRITKTTPDIIAVTNSDLTDFDISDMLSENYTLLPAQNNENNFMLSKLKVEKSGRINLDKSHQAPFMCIEHEQDLITFIAVDFSDFSYKEIASALKKLSSFISDQDNPVVIFGNFNNVSWSYPLSSFVAKNGLVVKNSMFDNFRNLITPAHHYILGFEEGNFQGNIFLSFLNSFSKFTRF